MDLTAVLRRRVASPRRRVVPVGARTHWEVGEPQSTPRVEVAAPAGVRARTNPPT